MAENTREIATKPVVETSETGNKPTVKTRGPSVTYKAVKDRDEAWVLSVKENNVFLVETATGNAFLNATEENEAYEWENTELATIEGVDSDENLWNPSELDRTPYLTRRGIPLKRDQMRVALDGEVLVWDDGKDIYFNKQEDGTYAALVRPEGALDKASACKSPAEYLKLRSSELQQRAAVKAQSGQNSNPNAVAYGNISPVGNALARAQDRMQRRTERTALSKTPDAVSTP